MSGLNNDTSQSQGNSTKDSQNTNQIRGYGSICKYPNQNFYRYIDSSGQVIIFESDKLSKVFTENVVQIPECRSHQIDDNLHENMQPSLLDKARLYASRIMRWVHFSSGRPETSVIMPGTEKPTDQPGISKAKLEDGSAVLIVVDTPQKK